MSSAELDQIADNGPQAAACGENDLQNHPSVPLAEAQTPDTQVADMRRDLSELRDLLAVVQDRLMKLENAVEATGKQVSFLPPQLRLLGSKVDGLTTAISEPRYRAVMLNLLGVYDLTDQLLRTQQTSQNLEYGADHHRNYEVLRAQLRQILEANGLSEITAEGSFNPELHRAVQRVPVADPALADQIIEVSRPGFRTEQAVLRFAEVTIGQYSPAVTDTQDFSQPVESPSGNDEQQ